VTSSSVAGYLPNNGRTGTLMRFDEVPA